MTDVTPGGGVSPEGTAGESNNGDNQPGGGAPAWGAPPPPAPPGAFPPPPPAPPGPPPGSGAFPPPPPPAQPPYGPPQGQPPGFPPQYQQPYGAGSQQWPLAAGPTDALGRPLSEWWKRLVAIIIDILIVGIPSSIIFVLLFGIGVASTHQVCNTTNFGTYCGTTSSGGGIFAALFLLPFLMLVVFILYTGLMEGSESGQTLGKKLLHIAVRDAQTGGAVGAGRAILRRVVYSVLWMVIYIPGIINCLSPLWDAKRQAWHDHAANTVVVDVP